MHRPRRSAASATSCAPGNGAAKYATTPGPAAVSVLELPPVETRVAPPSEDRAFTDRDGGQEFVEWFEATSVENLDPWSHVEAIPLSRVYEIADVARSRAEFWTTFAGCARDPRTPLGMMNCGQQTSLREIAA